MKNNLLSINEKIIKINNSLRKQLLNKFSDIKIFFIKNRFEGGIMKIAQSQ